MARPHYYKHGTINRTVTLSGDADEQLVTYARESKQTCSAAATELILAAFGREPELTKNYQTKQRNKT